MRKILLKLKNGWMAFAEKVGEINSAILLGIIFIVGIGIYAVFLKIFNSISKPFQKPKNSRWENFKNNQNSLEELTQEF